jgi:hypothetical protein
MNNSHSIFCVSHGQVSQPDNASRRYRTDIKSPNGHPENGAPIVSYEHRSESVSSLDYRFVNHGRQLYKLPDQADAPEIDGTFALMMGSTGFHRRYRHGRGDEAGEYDLWGRQVDRRFTNINDGRFSDTSPRGTRTARLTGQYDRFTRVSCGWFDRRRCDACMGDRAIIRWRQLRPHRLGFHDDFRLGL